MQARGVDARRAARRLEGERPRLGLDAGGPAADEQHLQRGARRLGRQAPREDEGVGAARQRQRGQAGRAGGRAHGLRDVRDGDRLRPARELREAARAARPRAVVGRLGDEPGQPVDWDALDAFVDAQIAGGVTGLVPCGTTGESPTLTHEEHDEIIVRTVKRARGRTQVVAGTGSNSTRETIELSQAARKVGADGLLLVTPYYNKPSQDHLYRHFKAVIQAVPLPTVLYNVPGRTACDMLPDTLARLCELPEVVGVKEATASALRASQIIAKTGDRLAVLSGDDATAFPLFALGARGVISVVSNVAPKEMSAMWDAAAAGDWQKARELHYKLLPLGEGLFVEANPVPVKAALAMMGRIADELRPPLYPLAEQHRDKLRGMLRDLRLL